MVAPMRRAGSVEPIRLDVAHVRLDSMLAPGRRRASALARHLGRDGVEDLE